MSVLTGGGEWLKTTLLTAALVLVAVNGVYGYRDMAMLNAFAVLVMTVYSVYVGRRNASTLVLFAFLLLCTWSFCYTIYFRRGFVSEYMVFRGTSVASKGIFIYLLFMLGIVLALPLRSARFPALSVFKRSGYQELVGVGLLIAITLLGVNGLGEQWRGNRAAINPLYEYSVILFIFAGMYLRPNRWGWRLAVVACMFRVALDFGSGNRITGAEFLVALLLVGYGDKLRLRSAIPIGTVLMAVVLYVGQIRAYVDSGTALSKGVSSYVDDAMAWDGAYSAYHTSMCFIDFADRMSHSSRMMYVLGFFRSIVFGGDSPTAFLSRALFNDCWNMGGGYLPFHLYFYFGYVGVLASGLMIGLYFRLLYSDFWLRSDTLTVGVIWVGCSFFRWYQYYPFSTIRGLILVVALSWIMSGVGRLVSVQSGPYRKWVTR